MKFNHKMNFCSKVCLASSRQCTEKDCKLWINFEEDHNCSNITVAKHGSLTLREIAAREGLTFARIQQIEKSALKKLAAAGKGKLREYLIK